MDFELQYKGKRVRLELSGKDAQLKDIKGFLETIHRIEQQYSEHELRNKVVKQLKNEILLETDGSEDVASQGWWDLPQDLLRNKETKQFLTMEADLNGAVHYEKSSFSLKQVVDEQGRQFVLDRESLRLGLQRMQLQDKISRTGAVLVRLKGSLSSDDQSEIEDYLKKFFRVERTKVLFEKKKYGDRVSLEAVLFGEFLE
jgi:hypothetical protein